MCRVHGEATKCLVFIGRQRNTWEPTSWVGTKCVVVFIGRAWTEQAMETRPGVPHNGGNGLVFDRPRSKRGPVDREGPGIAQNGGNGPPTVETGVLLIGRGVAYRKTGLHGILFISTVDLIQPPRATIDLLQPPRAPVHPASTARYSTGYCSTTPPRAPLHCLLFIQPSRPRGPVQPPLHGHPSTVYCSSSPPPHHGVLFIQRQRHRSLFIQTPPQRSLFIPEAASIGFS